MTKLIIQVPCYNEEDTLGLTLSALPREVTGIDKVEWLMVDDGSTDRTVEAGRTHGIDHIICLSQHQGLAGAFVAGLEASLRAGADIIVNVDADNQYCAEDIPKLIIPILSGKAEIVVGTRPISEISHFSLIKKWMHRLGSSTVRFASKTKISDAPSGFRAMSRDAAMQLNVFNEYTYTLETIIQAGQKGMAIMSVPIRTNKDLRPSRLVKSIPGYIMRSISTRVRICMTYRPFRFFAIPGFVSFGLGLLLSVRYLYFYYTGYGRGHIQSVILAALLLGTGFFLFIIGLLADLISVNRKLLEKLDYRMRQIEDHQIRKKDP
jgi:glycosyltransferase involved in cell wall biosynthesis